MRCRPKALVASATLFAFLVTGANALAEPPAGTCPNEELRVGKSARLAECRAYEQVSPPVKDYGVFGGFPFFALAAEEGSAVAFTTLGPLPGSASGTNQNVYLADRGSAGWNVDPLSPPVTPIAGSTTFPITEDFAPDLRHNAVLTENPTLTPEAQPDIPNLYVRNNNSDSWRLISSPQGADHGLRYTFEVIGYTPDFSHVVFSSREPLAEGVHSGLYESVGGEFRNVGILPNGEPAEEAILPQKTFNAVSEDGARIFFASGRDLYVRQNGETTVKVSPSQRTVTDPNYESRFPPNYEGATSNGRIVYFTSRVELTNDAATGTDSEGNLTDAGRDLYAFDVDTETLTDLTVDTNLSDERGADVVGMLGNSDDGSYVYFVARGALDGAASSGGLNLYFWHEGTVKYIATLASADEANWAGTAGFLTSRLTPDGRHLLLSSRARLTAYDNTDAETGEPDTEIYLYSAGSGDMACVSCRPDGTAPLASTSVESLNQIIHNHWRTSQYYSRAITDDGSKVAFETSEPLVPGDINGRLDVYLYAEGTLHLISTGSGEFDTRLGDISADGQDVFIGTSERLLPSDEDKYADLYDARVGGGYPAPPRVAVPCAGGECVRDSSSVPPSPVLGSTAFVGAGSLKSRHHTRCGRHAHLVRRHGRVRCVKKRRKYHPGGRK